MNDLELTLSNVDRIIEEARREDISFTEKAGLYAAMDAIKRSIDKHIDEDCGGDANAHEKIFNVNWFVGALLGFDATNDHPISQLVVFALANQDSLRNVLGQHKARRESQGEE